MPNTLIHDNSISWLNTGTSIKCGWVKLWAQRSPVLIDALWLSPGT